MLRGYCRSHHVVLPLLLLHHRDLTNRGHAHHHRLDTGQIKEKEEWGENGGSVRKKKGGEWRKGLPVRHAEFSGHRSSKGVDNRPRERRAGVETQADMPAPSGFTYLLLDVAVGDRDGAGRPVEEVLVGGDLTGLHRTTSTAQLLLRDTMKQQYVFF